MKNLSQPITTVANIALWLLTVFIAYTFAASCYQMFNGDDKASVDFLNKHGDKTLRYTIAVLEGVGAIMILLPATVVLGAALLGIAMIGVLSADMSSMGGIPAEPVLMLVLSLVLLVGRLKFSANLSLKGAE